MACSGAAPPGPAGLAISQAFRSVAARPAGATNEVADAVNTALGYQVNNRADISFKPRSHNADEVVASTLSRVAMQVAAMQTARNAYVNALKAALPVVPGSDTIKLS